MRLNLFISKCGYASRRAADLLIKEAKVTVNNKKVCAPFYQVEPTDVVKVMGKGISPKEHFYLMFNKPKGVTTTLRDKFAKEKVIDFFPDKFKGIFPVGRLDKQSKGLLILTNDGDLCYRLTHPKFLVEKEYLVEVVGSLGLSDCRLAKEGVKSEGDFLKVGKIKVLAKTQKTTLCKVVISEGKKRHLRRLFSNLGFKVSELERVRIGRLVLGNLRSGKYKLIPKDQIYPVR